MIRKIIHIDEEKCNGCGLCAKACHEGAIDIIDGKAKLTRENFCDGFGDCLPNCPTGAISFEEREAPAYDEAAVKAAQRTKQATPHACPGSAVRQLNTQSAQPAPAAAGMPASRLGQWPCQIKLVPVKAPFFDGTKLLIAADCTAYAYANMHEEFMRGKVSSSAVPSLTAWTTPKSWAKSSRRTTSGASLSCGCRCPAAEVFSARRSGLCRPAASSFPGR